MLSETDFRAMDKQNLRIQVKIETEFFFSCEEHNLTSAWEEQFHQNLSDRNQQPYNLESVVG